MLQVQEATMAEDQGMEEEAEVATEVVVQATATRAVVLVAAVTEATEAMMEVRIASALTVWDSWIIKVGL